MYEIVEIAKLVLMIIICVCICKLLSIPKSTDLSTITDKKITEGLKKIPGGYLSYERLEKYLKQMGKEETPTKYIMIKVGFSLAFMLIGLREENILIILGLGILGFFIPDYTVKRGNDRDNEEMIMDIKLVYDTLRIQTKAGVFINKAISECYLIVSNERLKEGLLMLSSKLNKDNDIELALDEFKSRFKNPYIDTFCIVIQQSLESGQTIQILEDLSEQINDLEEAMYIRKEDQVEGKLSRQQFFIFIGVIMIAIYGMGISIISSVSQF